MCKITLFSKKERVSESLKLSETRSGHRVLIRVSKAPREQTHLRHCCGGRRLPGSGRKGEDLFQLQYWSWSGA